MWWVSFLLWLPHVLPSQLSCILRICNENSKQTVRFSLELLLVSTFYYMNKISYRFVQFKTDMQNLPHFNRDYKQLRLLKEKHIYISVFVVCKLAIFLTVEFYESYRFSHGERGNWTIFKYCKVNTLIFKTLSSTSLFFTFFYKTIIFELNNLKIKSRWDF